MPILILQGADDKVVPQWETDILFERLSPNGKPKTQYRILEGRDHVTSFTSTIGDQLE